MQNITATKGETMRYQSELDFAKRILSHFRLKTHIITEENHSVSEIDMGLRKLLGMEEQHNLSKAFISEQIKPNTIYKLIDLFYCNYFNTYFIVCKCPTNDIFYNSSSNKKIFNVFKIFI